MRTDDVLKALLARELTGISGSAKGKSRQPIPQAQLGNPVVRELLMARNISFPGSNSLYHEYLYSSRGDVGNIVRQPNLFLSLLAGIVLDAH